MKIFSDLENGKFPNLSCEDCVKFSCGRHRLSSTGFQDFSTGPVNEITWLKETRIPIFRNALWRVYVKAMMPEIFQVSNLYGHGILENFVSQITFDAFVIFSNFI